MTRPVRIHPEEPVILPDDRLEVAARVESPRAWWARRARRLWFRAPAAEAEATPGDATSALLGVLFRCMELGRPVHVHGTLAPGLVENLERFQANWERWCPARYRRVPIEAAGTTPAAGPGTGALVAYSGGIDSTYTVLRGLAGDAPEMPEPLRACVMVHGFDIALAQQDGFAVAADRARRILSSRSVPLHLASTNVRAFKQDWVDCNRAAIASVLHLFRGRYAVGLASNGYQEDLARRIYPPEVEDIPLLASDDLPLRFGPADLDRVGRLGALIDWPEALADLRVCWVHPSGSANCGRCGKCIIVILAARVVGAGRLPCFDRDIQDEEILAMLEDKHAVIPVRADQLLAHARRRGLDEPWMAVAEQVRGDDPLRRFRREAQAAGRDLPDA